jgi:branched-subunit amino acid aminotransferase/4-amino-4-deoxychorismate lyase
MSDQGEIPDRRDDGFGLIETLCWSVDGGFHYLDEHLSRLAASARTLGFAYDEAAFLAALRAAAAAPTAERLRIRCVLARDGGFETGVAAIEPLPPRTVWRVAPARRRFSSADPLLRHKTTLRDRYENELAEAARIGADEVLFLNERDEVCEGARTNVFLVRGGELLTPPLASGLLPGTLRARLLASGRAREHVLRLEDFVGAEFHMGNSVRGLTRAELIT